MGLFFVKVLLKFYNIVFYLKCIYIFALNKQYKNKHYEKIIYEFLFSIFIMDRITFNAIIN